MMPRCMEISVTRQGTEVEAVESLLLEMFGRFERSEVHVVEKALHHRIASSHTLYRYRVHSEYSPVRGWGGELVERLKVRTRCDIHIVDEKDLYIFEVDRPRAVD